MRKLNILKSIVDCVLIVISTIFLFVIIISILFILDSEILTIAGKSLLNGIKIIGIWGKIALIISLANSALILYILFNFKILLENFLEKLIFEIETCMLLNRIGKLIIYSSFIDILSELILKLSKSEIGFSFSSFLYGLSMGLFFLVLAEVFKMAKDLKEENELTI
jgi:hypothetical protein